MSEFTLLKWHNMKTGELQYFDPHNCDDETAKQFIPQSEAAQRLYDLYREHRGMSCLEAIVAILETACGVNQPADQAAKEAAE